MNNAAKGAFVTKHEVVHVIGLCRFARNAASKKENMDFSKKSNQFPSQLSNECKIPAQKFFSIKIIGRFAVEFSKNQLFLHYKTKDIS